jgi:hypothetical protein
MAYRKYKDIVPFGIRMQPDLKARLEKLSKGKPKWSLNAEIVKRLEDSLEIRHELSAFTDGELVDEIVRRWGRESIRLSVTIGRSPEDEIISKYSPE